MFTTVMVGAILTVLQWVFWVTGGLYLLAALALVIRGDGPPQTALVFAAVLGAAGFLCRFFRRRPAPRI